MLPARIAGAPISWGVSEVPGWGHQLDRDRVLSEMRDLGLTATEFGPPGFLPADPETMAKELASFGLAAVGGFLVVVLHDPRHDPLAEVDSFLDGCVVAGAEVAVLAAGTGDHGYDSRPELDETSWKTLLLNLDRIDQLAARRGVLATIHPHIGTMVESAAEVQRVLTGCAIGLCVDTGHLLIGGTDPVALTRDNVERVAHVHLKDVDAGLARQVLDRSMTFTAAVGTGMFRPLGQGDVDIASMVATLDAYGYPGWYVLEQDVRLDGDPRGSGPAADVALSLDYLMRLDGARRVSNER